MTQRFRSKAFWIGTLTASLVLLFVGSIVFVVATLPDVSFLADENPTETALMNQRGGPRTQDWVALADISPWLVRAVLMGEDAGFYGHNGFDTHEMKEAFKRNWEEGRTVRGASTLTQQLAKNLFLSSERTYSRKLKEAVLTYRLEKSLSKSRILEIYLNVIEWGDGIYGAEAAAKDVYGKSALWVDASEAATLAAMIPSPSRLHPCEEPKSVRIRRDRILNWMQGAGDLTEEELREALASEPELRQCP
jgi:monofunctional biosynthetic peptidoglycan transglycosylase